MKRILILKTGETARAVQEHHGDYDRWFIDAMVRPGLSFETCDATRGAIPALDRFHGVIVTGSVSAAYRSEPWMPALGGFLSGVESPRVPVLCVCFGAQLLAQARGGRVSLNPEGWEIGSVEIQMTDAGLDDPLFAGLPRVFTALATHEDRIEALPAGAALLASNSNAAVQAFRAGDRLWGVQFHPEATISIIGKLIGLRTAALTHDAVARGRPVDGHVERLAGSLERGEPNQARRMLDNFLRICLAE